MSAQIRVCPTCNHENGATAPFCEQCGRMIVLLEKEARVFKAPCGPESEPEPDKSTVSPKPDTEETLRNVVTRCGYEHKKTTAGYRVVVPTMNGRSQTVHVLFNGRDDEGRDIISFLSFCGRAKTSHAMEFLRLNIKLTYCAFAVRAAKGPEHVVVTANQLAETADPGEIRKKLSEVAKWADAVEKKITHGRDTL